MPRVDMNRPSSLADLVWRRAFAAAFPLARLWWHVRRPRHEGALVAIWVGSALLLLQSSYRASLNFPGGSIRHGETPEAAARRELVEEIGLTVANLTPAGFVEGLFDGRRDRVHLFEARLARLPLVKVDNREIVAAHLVKHGELHRLALTGPVAAYVDRIPDLVGAP